MPFPQVKSSTSVWAAVDEYDRLGGKQFRSRYGFGPADEYFVMAGGRLYDSKAILGVAQLLEDPSWGPSPNVFHGGQPVLNRLSALGFDVLRDSRCGDFLRAVASIDVISNSEIPRASKPLLLLAALGRAAIDDAPLSSFASYDSILRRLTPKFSDEQPPQSGKATWVGLVGDGLWEVSSDSGEIVLKPNDTRSSQPLPDAEQWLGGFPEPFHNLLRERPELVASAADAIVDRFFGARPSDERVELLGLAGTNPRRAWLFQANPDYYDIDAALNALDELTWTVPQYDKQVNPGDLMYFWKARPGGGIIARGRVLLHPQLMEAEDHEQAFMLTPERFEGEQIRTRVRLEGVLETPAGPDIMRSNPRLADLAVLKFANATVFAVTQSERLALDELFQPAVETNGRLAARRYFILQQRARDGYDWDEEGVLYHFTQGAGGAWKKLSEASDAAFVYYRPGNSGGATAKTYFGAGTISSVDEQEQDGVRHFLAHVTDYAAFARPVPMAEYDPRPNAQMSICEITQSQFERLVELGSNGTPPTTDVTYAEILGAINATGLVLPEETIRRYHLSLKTRGFVILAGVSGSGKTWLAEAYADAARGESLVVPVAPNWTTNEDLLGYLNPLDDRYHDTDFSRFLRAASKEWSSARQEGRTPKPHYLVLDEMNLARVEYYFAKFLSAMERRARDEDARLELSPDTTDHVLLPKNLFVTGTVNIDETTFGFADKVYDRAQLIEIPVSRAVLSEHLAGQPYSPHLLEVWDVLSPVAPFAFRVVDEIGAYVQAAAELGVTWEQALDEQLLQKVLPKIKGTDLRLRSALTRFVEISEDRFPLSHAKAAALLAAFVEHGFTDFFSV